MRRGACPGPGPTGGRAGSRRPRPAPPSCESVGRVALAAAFGLSLVALSGVGASAAPARTQAVYTLVINSRSVKCLDVPENSNSNNQGIEQYECNGNGNQLWTLESQGDGFFRVINENSRKCLDVRGRSANNNAVVVQNGCNAEFSQQWSLLPDSDGVGTRLAARHSDSA
ncbi:RICIN domain-containing protein [Streptomyces xiangluensis]|uniref:RICIN domain-containing protein n=1 Tax=Streptomyces xiangluensis TaxID=2665720 RepID=A0ABV8YNI7_9ACTN